VTKTAASLRRQKGFVQRLWQIVGAVIVLALAGRFVWWVATEESFDQVAAILWAIGFGIAYFITLDQVFVRRVAAGFWVFLLVALVSLPLSWMAASTVALLALLAAQLAFSFYAGHAITARRLARGTAAGGSGEGASLRDGDRVADFGRWILLSFGALMLFLIGPLVALLIITLMVDLSQQEIRWLVAAWGLAGTTWFGYKFSAAQWRRVPACAGIYLLVTAAILIADALAGPFSEGTGIQVAYTTMPGSLVAAFVEVFFLGGGRLPPDDGRPAADD
jgi:hypothetical protein